MRSNYKRLGNYIREVNIRNKNLRAKTLLGINIDKYFMPSVANIVGTDLSAYKIVQPDHFACNRMHVGRDYRLPIALSRDTEDFIVSPAYDVFKVLDENILLPEYLMMWFSRKEFDRNAWFYTDGDVRGGLPWKSFCDMQLPVPDINKQKELVKEYHTIVNRIDLNNQFIQKLEETAQAIYKQWFVDFEFPDENGKPHRSGGGRMEFSEELQKEIPINWQLKKVGDVIEIMGGGTPSTDENEFWQNGDILWYSPTDVTNSNCLFTNNTEYKITKLGLQRSSAKMFPPYSLLMTSRATIGKLTINTIEATTNQGFITMLPTKFISVYFLFEWVKTKLDYINSLASGSTFPEISKSDFKNIDFLCPSEQICKKFNAFVPSIYNNIRLKNEENIELKILKNILLSKLASVQ